MVDMMEQAFQSIPVWLVSSLLFAAGIAGALIGHNILFRVAGRIVGKTVTGIDNTLVKRSREPVRWLLVLLVVLLFLPGAGIPEGLRGVLHQALIIGLTASVGWLAASLTGMLTDFVNDSYPLDSADNLRARQIHTQMAMIRRIAITVIVVIVLCLILMTFPQARQIGISLFASAGVAGLVIGMAARPALSNLIAGVQLAFTQPIRIDDVVIVEGEWGWIEEIGTTFVVVRIWDLRRLVVPLSHFIEKPFQNWTRQTADILGTIFVYADYTVPVGAVRDKLQEIVKASDLWDGKVCGLQVTDAKENTLELRALVSSSDSGKCWDLRCHVREELVCFFQAEYPECLPRIRMDLREQADRPTSPPPP